MDIRIQKSTRINEGNLRLQRTNPEEICSNSKSKKKKSGRRQEAKPIEIVDADQVKLCIDHFFPNNFINKCFDKIIDPRVEAMCFYDITHIAWLGILMFLLRIGSRQQLKKDRETDSFRLNLLALSCSDEEYIAHPDSLNYLLKHLSVHAFENVKVQMIKKLIKDKRLDFFRFNNGDFRIAIDATQIFSFKEQHCEHCLKTTHSSGVVTWSHKMLEAKLVAENGFSLSICSEPIENLNGEYTKQDCELNAFYRLAKRLKNIYPRTYFCLLLDGLYACQEVFNTCKKNHWDFIIVFKEKRIPTLFKKAQDEMEKSPQNTLILIKENDITQELSWVHYLNYKKHYVHVFCCNEKQRKKDSKISKWVWISSIVPDKNNIKKLVNKGGRQRWKIENQGFNEQKNNGFELKHLYGKHENAWKNYYQLLQIAHIIDQLIRYGDFCKKLQEHSSNQNNKSIMSFRKYYQSTKNFIKRLLESFRNQTFSNLAYELPGTIQIRFNSS